MFREALILLKEFSQQKDIVNKLRAWLKVVPEQQLVNLLKESHMLESLVDFYCETRNFSEALKLCEILPSKRHEVFLLKAMTDEEEGKFKEAEEAYLQLRKFEMAIQMYLGIKDFPQAVRIAQLYDNSALDEVHI